jgi:hypothetical protein
MMIFASVIDPNSSMVSSSSRRRPLKDSTNGFSHGEPGSMYAVFVPARRQ